MSYFHTPVLLKEVVDLINPQPGENLVDGTLGGGGHAEAILEKTGPGGKLLGIDLDEEAIMESKKKLKKYSVRIIIEKGNFTNFVTFKNKYNFYPIDIFFLDLGISSRQLEDKSSGISFSRNAPLDMRMGGEKSKNRMTAEFIINKWKEEDLKSLFRKYGEEKYAGNIAGKIIKERKFKKITDVLQLVEIISRAVPGKYKRQKIHFATRTFQALRIEVNKELENLEKVLPIAIEEMERGSRIAIISFHSLEDRIVKKFFQREAKDCVCGPEAPICACCHRKKIKIINKKPATPSMEEILKNPRSRSAKLRVAEKI